MSSDGAAERDVRLQNGNARFSLRAAAVILRDGCILLARHEEHDCFYTIGGGVRLNEASGDAVRRECLEETGCPFAIERLLFLQERFYTAGGMAHHEVVFFYLMKDDGQALPDGRQTDQPGERLYWVPVAELKDACLAPAFLRTALCQLPQEPVHVVSWE